MPVTTLRRDDDADISTIAPAALAAETAVPPIVARISEHPYVRLASDARFVAFWLGQTISLFGDRLHQVALAVLVFGVTDSALATALVFLTAALPNLLVAPIAGTFVEGYDLVAQYHLLPVREVIFRMDHRLLGVPGATLAGLRRIEGHPIVLEECGKFLATLPAARPVPAIDTGVAARDVAEAKDPSIAAIATSRPVLICPSV